MKWVIFAWALSLFVILIAGARAAMAEEENLLPNPGFKVFKGTIDDNNTDKFDGWINYLEPKSAKVLVVADSGKAEAGRIFEISVMDDKGSAIVYADIEAKPDTEYMLTGSVKSPGGIINGTYRIGAVEVLQSGAEKYYNAVDDNKPLKEFKEISVTFKTTSSPKKLRIAIGIRGKSKEEFSGAARFTNISLVEKSK